MARSGTVEMATAISALVLLRKMRCIFFVTIMGGKDMFVCSLRKTPFLPFCQSFSTEAPFILHALPSQTISGFNFLSQRHYTLSYII